MKSKSMHSIYQALHLCSTLPTSKIAMFVSAAFVFARMFFQVKNGILMRSPRPKAGWEINNLGPEARMVVFFVKGFVLQT